MSGKHLKRVSFLSKQENKERLTKWVELKDLLSISDEFQAGMGGTSVVQEV